MIIANQFLVKTISGRNGTTAAFGDRSYLEFRLQAVSGYSHAEPRERGTPGKLRRFPKEQCEDAPWPTGASGNRSRRGNWKAPLAPAG
jgi:hypothetical protein